MQQPRVQPVRTPTYLPASQSHAFVNQSTPTPETIVAQQPPTIGQPPSPAQSPASLAKQSSFKREKQRQTSLQQWLHRTSSAHNHHNVPVTNTSTAASSLCCSTSVSSLPAQQATTVCNRDTVYEAKAAPDHLECRGCCIGRHTTPNRVDVSQHCSGVAGSVIICTPQESRTVSSTNQTAHSHVTTLEQGQQREQAIGAEQLQTPCITPTTGERRDLPQYKRRLIQQTAANNEQLLVDTGRTVKAACGVRMMWVSADARRQGIASSLLDVARRHCLAGYIVPRRLMAFSQPTCDGRRLAEAYTSTQAFLVYSSTSSA